MALSGPVAVGNPAPKSGAGYPRREISLLPLTGCQPTAEDEASDADLTEWMHQQNSRWVTVCCNPESAGRRSALGEVF